MTRRLASMPQTNPFLARRDSRPPPGSDCRASSPNLLHVSNEMIHVSVHDLRRRWVLHENKIEEDGLRRLTALFYARVRVDPKLGVRQSTFRFRTKCLVNNIVTRIADLTAGLHSCAAGSRPECIFGGGRRSRPCRVTSNFRHSWGHYTGPPVQIDIWQANMILKFICQSHPLREERPWHIL